MLIEQIKNDITAARKSGEKFKVILLSTIVGEVQRVSENLDDKAVVKTIKKIVESNTQMLNICDSEVIRTENRILQGYLPRTLSERETRELLAGCASDVQNAPNFGIAMGIAMRELNRVSTLKDNDIVRRVVENIRNTNG